MAGAPVCDLVPMVLFLVCRSWFGVGELPGRAGEAHTRIGVRIGGWVRTHSLQTPLNSQLGTFSNRPRGGGRSCKLLGGRLPVSLPGTPRPAGFFGGSGLSGSPSPSVCSPSGPSLSGVGCLLSARHVSVGPGDLILCPPAPGSHQQPNFVCQD